MSTLAGGPATAGNRSPSAHPARGRGPAALWLVPLVLYALIFFAFTFPLFARFSTHFFADDGDGLQNVWNLWWVDFAVTRLHVSPWFTRYLHFPQGTTLLGHTLNPFNGFVGIALQPWLGLVRTHNAIVVFSFVAGAWTAFRLSLHVTRRYVGSLIAGFAFSFSSFHFAHALGHLQLVSLEWIPLFLLAWLRLLERPSLLRALLAAAALFLVLLCDHYYFFFSVLAGGLALVASAIRRRSGSFWLRPPFAAPIAAFTALCALTSGALIAPLLWLAARDPLSGVHDPGTFSLDALALWIPGGCWRFHALTEPFWSQVPGGVSESSVSLGVAATIAMAFVARRRRSFRELELGTWWAILAFFAVMSLGPFLHVWGRPIPILLPYRAFELLFPPLRLSGCPVRMMVMVTLAAGILTGLGLDELWRRGSRARAAAVLLVLGMAVELLPGPLPTTDASRVPGWVPVLAARPEGYGLMDASQAASDTEALYFQTLHRRPMAGGYVSRVPASVLRQDRELEELRARGDYEALCAEHGFAYFLVREGGARSGLPVPPVWRGDGLELYDVGSAWPCKRSLRVP